MDVKATLETKISKAGNEYKCLVIKLTDDYEKTVYLDKAELALIELYNPTHKPQDFPFSS